MRIRISLWVLILLAPGAVFAQLQVVTTTPDLASIVASLGGENVSVTNLVSPDEDPHYLDPRPSLAVKLSRADLLVAVGLDLEVGWLPVLVRAARNPDIVAGKPGYLEAAGFVQVLDVPRGQVDRSMGDIHPGGNPHFNFEPASMLRVAAGIAKRLGDLDPPNRSVYAENLQSLQAALAPVLQMQLKGVRVISFHKSLSYLARWLGLDVIDVIETRPGVSPSPRHVVKLIQDAQSKSIQMVVQESWYPTNISELVARKAGIPFVSVPGSSAPDADGYSQFLQQIEALIRQAAAL